MTRFKKVIVGVIGGCAVIAGSMALGQLAEADTPPTAAEVLGSLALSSTPADALPSYVSLKTIAPTPVRASTVHRLGQTEGGTMYVALTDENLVCLITAVNGPEQAAGSNCTTLTDFAKRGLSSASAVQSGAATESYLFPHGFTPEANALAQTIALASAVAPAASSAVGFVTVDPRSPSTAPLTASSGTSTMSITNLTEMK